MEIVGWSGGAGAPCLPRSCEPGREWPSLTCPAPGTKGYSAWYALGLRQLRD